MIIKTAELEGAALDWAVAKAVGEKYSRISHFTGDVNAIYEELFQPSSDWEEGGPLIEKYMPSLDFDGEFLWWSVISTVKPWVFAKGKTPLIAAMRAIVVRELGDEVDVPDELIKA